MIERIDGEEIRTGKMDISELNERAIFMSRTEEASLLVIASSEYIQNPKKHLFVVHLLTRAEKIYCKSYKGLTMSMIPSAAPPSPRFSTNLFSHK